MSRSVTFCLLIILLGQHLFAHPTASPDSLTQKIISELTLEIDQVTSKYNQKNVALHQKIRFINNNLKTSTNCHEQVQLLIEKEIVKEVLATNYSLEQADISKIRYIKGLEIIKLLYDKVLALDHHFASIETLNDITKMANPNAYPDFVKIKESLPQKKENKLGFALTKILSSNIYTSVVYSFISLFNNDTKTRAEKDDSIKNIECILDFTLRMQNDLNTIYFETAYLQKNNEGIKSDLELLFTNYTKNLKYTATLATCRNNDDWDTIKESLNQYMTTLNATIKNPSQTAKAQKMQVNLEFPIDRLLQFITQYNSFIDQGSKFYQKFNIMLNSYENEKQCSSKIPLEYKKMKDGIIVAIGKFNTAYKPVEINGSKMKEILYGVNEYE